MASSRIASRYSKSLLELAKEANTLDAVKADMELVLDTCSGSKDLTNLLNSPVISAADKKAVLSKVFKDATQSTQNFIAFLVDRSREGELALVASQFISAYEKMKGIARVTVVSAIALPADTLEQVKAYTGGLIGEDNIELTNEIDASLIGGMVIKYEDRLLDMSVAKELREIRKELIFN